MATPFRLLAMRLPRTTTTTSLYRVTSSSPIRHLTPLQSIRLASDLATSAKKAPNATKYNTASKLAANPSASGASASEVSSTKNTTTTTTTSQPGLTWNTFFTLRLQKRRIQLLFSLLAGLGGAASGAIALQAFNLVESPLLSQVPLDPFITLGMVVMACGAMGWLLGPILGSQVFYLMNSSRAGAIRAKEGEFLTRVRRNRSDPTNSSAGNPVPDYYGEKIQSVAGYRRWLKDQRAFNKKKTQAFI